jgi:hypothetical protein
LVEFEKQPVEVQGIEEGYRSHVRGIYGIHLTLLKENLIEHNMYIVTGWGLGNTKLF